MQIKTYTETDCTWLTCETKYCTSYHNVSHAVQKFSFLSIKWISYPFIPNYLGRNSPNFTRGGQFTIMGSTCFFVAIVGLFLTMNLLHKVCIAPWACGVGKMQAFTVPGRQCQTRSCYWLHCMVLKDNNVSFF